MSHDRPECAGPYQSIIDDMQSAAEFDDLAVRIEETIEALQSVGWTGDNDPRLALADVLGKSAVGLRKQVSLALERSYLRLGRAIGVSP